MTSRPWTQRVSYGSLDQQPSLLLDARPRDISHAIQPTPRRVSQQSPPSFDPTISVGVMGTASQHQGATPGNRVSTSPPARQGPPFERGPVRQGEDSQISFSSPSKYSRRNSPPLRGQWMNSGMDLDFDRSQSQFSRSSEEVVCQNLGFGFHGFRSCEQRSRSFPAMEFGGWMLYLCMHTKCTCICICVNRFDWRGSWRNSVNRYAK